MRKLIIYCSFIVTLIGWAAGLSAQNNVGINNRKPDLSAILDIQDSVRGLLLPRTDTQSVWNYVNPLPGNPGIANGLAIFETNMNTIYVFNGVKQKWEPISSLNGARGVIGPTGPRGPLGPVGISTQWRDSSLLDPVKVDPITNNIPPYFKRLGDTCGDVYHQTATGLIWTYSCDSNKWVGPIARWRNFGPGKIVDINLTGFRELTMAPDTSQNNLSLLGNLSFTFTVPPDTTAHIFVTSQGTALKSKRNDTAFNKLVFDFFVIDANGGSYFGSQKTITVGPNFLVTSSNFSQFDRAPWHIAMATSFEGNISPPRNPLPKTAFKTFTIQTHAGQFFRPDNPIGNNGKVTISDGGASLKNSYASFSYMNVYIIFERSNNAPYPY